MKGKMKIFVGILVIVVLAIFLLFKFTSANNNKLKFRVICESEDIYKIFYTMYVDDQKYSTGGFSDLDGNVITDKTDLSFSFSKDYFEGNDISKISFEFSPYGKDDVEEIGITNKLKINAKYGNEYVITFSGDRESGFKAEVMDN